MRMARRWATGLLADIGREDLIDSTELGVTELVTNAIIHARPPLTIRMRGTVEDPRIEIRDHSPVPPRQPIPAPPSDAASTADLATYGRGLGLVSMASRSWGAHLDHGGESKVVWFIPTAEVGSGTDHEGDVFELEQPPLVDADQVTAHDHMVVTLMDLPVELFAELRRYVFELRRELRLLSLTSPERYPLAVALNEAFAQSDDERRDTVGVDRLDQAIAEGEKTLELMVIPPISSGTTYARIRDLLAELYQAFAEENLLVLRPRDELVALHRWYLTEYARQAVGAMPIPYSPAG